MFGSWRSQTRKLNSHYQSTGAALAAPVFLAFYAANMPLGLGVTATGSRAGTIPLVPFQVGVQGSGDWQKLATTTQVGDVWRVDFNRPYKITGAPETIFWNEANIKTPDGAIQNYRNGAWMYVAASVRLYVSRKPLTVVEAPPPPTILQPGIEPVFAMSVNKAGEVQSISANDYVTATQLRIDETPNGNEMVAAADVSRLSWVENRETFTIVIDSNTIKGAWKPNSITNSWRGGDVLHPYTGTSNPWPMGPDETYWAAAFTPGLTVELNTRINDFIWRPLP